MEIIYVNQKKMYLLPCQFDRSDPPRGRTDSVGWFRRFASNSSIPRTRTVSRNLARQRSISLYVHIHVTTASAAASHAWLAIL
jgi:hypothetical protein